MDSRTTLNVNETFLETLESCLRLQQKAHLIVDENGMVRREGFVRSIDKQAGSISIELNNGDRIDLSKIIAVNGIFRPEYGEC